MAHYCGVATEQGITAEEIVTVKTIVMAVAAGRVEAQFKEATIPKQAIASADATRQPERNANLKNDQ